MAFCLRQDESIPKGLHRLARKELKAASDEVSRSDPPSDDAIHEARKSVKKVRVLLRLVKADNGKGLGKGPKRLRLVNRTLSQVRDADAMLEVLNKLRHRNQRLFDDRTFVRVRRHLSAHKRDVTKAAEHDEAWPKVINELQKIRRSADRWHPAHSGFRVVGNAVRLSHDRGRKAMDRARQTGKADDFHKWRKEMKALWYTLRLLEECSPRIKHDVRVLHQAETWLGDEHNLAVFCAELSKDASMCDGTIDLDRLRSTSKRYQCDLRKKAIGSTATIFRRKSDSYVRGMKRAWKACSRQGKNGRG